MRPGYEFKQLLSTNLSDLKTRYPIANMALFGSVMREDFDIDRSDIDILVEFNGEIGWEFFDLENELKLLLGRKVDLVSKNALKPHYWEFIKKDVLNV